MRRLELVLAFVVFGGMFGALAALILTGAVVHACRQRPLLDTTFELWVGIMLCFVTYICVQVARDSWSGRL